MHLILSDSLSCLLALRAFTPDKPIIQDILKCLNTLECAEKYVKFYWIPSHEGICGTELADAAARRAASAPCTRRFPFPARDHNPAIRSFVQSQRQRAWDEQANKLRAMKPQLKQWPSSLHRNRHDEACFVQKAHRLHVRNSWIHFAWSR